MDSILTSIKKLLGIEEDYEHFDTDIIMYINGALTTLNQAGLGPSGGFRISDKTSTWADFTTRLDVELLKTFVYLSCRLIFDPPLHAYLVTSIGEQLKESLWRLNVQAESLATP